MTKSESPCTFRTASHLTADIDTDDYADAVNSDGEVDYGIVGNADNVGVDALIHRDDVIM